jgi:hypothetical protein
MSPQYHNHMQQGKKPRGEKGPCCRTEALSASSFVAARGPVREIDEDEHRCSTGLLEGRRQNRERSQTAHSFQTNARKLVSARSEQAKRAKRPLLQSKTTICINTDQEVWSSGSLGKQNSSDSVKHQLCSDAMPTEYGDTTSTGVFHYESKYYPK